ncbi:coenzyme F420-0:L-glutamate ligase [Candidatus Bathyarchaeota archaeon]|nr:MAG: coenzyme F420-0:L-glutamate ligase [Candidatus Bathyarchaeota archaeon]
MRIFPIRTDVIKLGDNIVDTILRAMEKQGLIFDNGDILALTSKIIAYAENRIVKLDEVKPSEDAEKLARKFAITSQLAELIMREAEEIYGGVEKAVLTLKNGVLTSNAGIDNKNAPEGAVVLWPKNPEKWAKSIREEIMRRTGKKVAVLIVDSGLRPLRLGTTGLALATAGFKPTRDCRGERDIFGKKLTITLHGVADDLASIAHLLMGESSEKIPAVLIKGAPADFDDGVYGSEGMTLPPEHCIFMNSFKSKQKVKC